jgi:hypothetical protein
MGVGGITVAQSMILNDGRKVIAKVRRCSVTRVN